MMFPLEQSTILMVDGMVKVAGVIPTAVTNRLNERLASTFEVNLTYEVVY